MDPIQRPHHVTWVTNKEATTSTPTSYVSTYNKNIILDLHYLGAFVPYWYRWTCSGNSLHTAGSLRVKHLVITT
jgi:hypothetical protein